MAGASLLPPRPHAVRNGDVREPQSAPNDLVPHLIVDRRLAARVRDRDKQRELVRGLVSALEGGHLKVAKGLPLADALAGELKAFRVRLTRGSRDTYAARSGQHDTVSS